ncbi:MAG: hypothetical protein AAF518_27960 [Spirochaetota bacterium]
MRSPPLNPFDASAKFIDKDPKDMTLEELRMLLHIQRLGLQLNVEKIKSRVGYFQMVLQSAKDMGLLEKLDKWVMAFLGKEATAADEVQE